MDAEQAMTMAMAEKEGNEEYPLGFRFYPTEEELVSFYLRHQLDGKLPEKHRVIPLLNIYDAEPWDLPKFAGELCRGDSEQWFFFVPRQEREARGGRPSRTTGTGYWKATGSPVYVYSSDNKVIGVKKTMVFYKGRAPTGTKTKWKMNEYRAIDEVANPSPSAVIRKLRYEFILCRVYVISGCFGAFDRRPLEVITGTQKRGKNTVPTPDRILKSVEEIARSPETSCSVPGMAQTSGYCGGSSSNWGMVDEEFEEAVWEWDQFDWPKNPLYLNL